MDNVHKRDEKKRGRRKKYSTHLIGSVSLFLLHQRSACKGRQYETLKNYKKHCNDRNCERPAMAGALEGCHWEGELGVSWIEEVNPNKWWVLCGRGEHVLYLLVSLNPANWFIMTLGRVIVQKNIASSDQPAKRKAVIWLTCGDFCFMFVRRVETQVNLKWWHGRHGGHYEHPPALLPTWPFLGSLVQFPSKMPIPFQVPSFFFDLLMMMMMICQCEHSRIPWPDVHLNLFFINFCLIFQKARYVLSTTDLIIYAYLLWFLPCSCSMSGPLAAADMLVRTHQYFHNGLLGIISAFIWFLALVNIGAVLLCGSQIWDTSEKLLRLLYFVYWFIT